MFSAARTLEELAVRSHAAVTLAPATSPASTPTSVSIKPPSKSGIDCPQPVLRSLTSGTPPAGRRLRNSRAREGVTTSAQSLAPSG